MGAADAEFCEYAPAAPAFEPGVVLDPFVGSGTSMKVAVELGRSAVGIDINPGYVTLIRQRVPQLSIKDVVSSQVPRSPAWSAKPVPQEPNQGQRGFPVTNITSITNGDKTHGVPRFVITELPMWRSPA